MPTSTPFFFNNTYTMNIDFAASMNRIDLLSYFHFKQKSPVFSTMQDSHVLFDQCVFDQNNNYNDSSDASICGFLVSVKADTI